MLSRYRNAAFDLLADLGGCAAQQQAGSYQDHDHADHRANDQRSVRLALPAGDLASSGAPGTASGHLQ